MFAEWPSERGDKMRNGGSVRMVTVSPTAFRNAPINRGPSFFSA
jgi:hypothetical protein